MDRPTLETERGSLIPRDVEIFRKDAQLRVTPSEVKFLDAQVGKVYRHPITVHNLGRCNQKIRFQEPTKPQVMYQGVPGAGPGVGRGSEGASRPGRLCLPREIDI